MRAYDLAVVGAGVAGSAVAYFASRAGVRTLLLDRHGAGHALGSSHGAARIYRTVYSEGPHFVPLTLRAQKLWHELARASRQELLLATGALMLGPPDGGIVGGARSSASAHRLPHERLTSEEVRRRFPAFSPRAEEAAVFDPQAGLLYADRCLQALHEGARTAGAELRFDEPLRSWSVEDGQVVLRTAREELRSRAVVLAVGPWMPELVPELRPVLRVERQAVFFLDPPPPSDRTRPRSMPVFVWEAGPHGLFYGLPDLGEGVKVAHHGGPTVASPEEVDRRVSLSDEGPVRAFVADRLPGANGPVRSSTTCLYTVAPEGNFLIGPHPRLPNVWLVSACSGHGFKFATAIGESVALRVRGESPVVDLSPFDPRKVLAPRSR